VAPPATLADATDCDDTAAAVNPAAVELCNGIDDDCDGLVDDADPDVADPDTWYADADGDGFGDPGASTLACVAPPATLADTTDCDDAAASVNPTAIELCNGIDDDCDGLVDEDACFAGSAYGEADTFAVIRNTQAGAGFAATLTALGDTDGDGADDILLLDDEATDTLSRQGAAYLFRGPLSGAYTPADADAVLYGESAGDALDFTTHAGDLDGDGFDDIVLGGAHASPLGYTAEGGAFVLYGPASGSISLAAADATIAGGADRRYLRIADGLGDINGDGNADLALCSWAAGISSADTAAVFYGPLAGDLTLDDADLLLHGAAADDGLGELAGGVDLDGDGVGDFVAGAPFNDTTAYAGGAVYVILGPLTSGNVDSLYDYRYTGDSTNDWLGTTVQLLPDVDGDGYGELLAGSWSERSATLVHGGPLPPSGRINTRADARFTSTTTGVADRNGQPRDAGDLDGNGDHELVVSDGGEDWMGTGEGVAGVFDDPTGTLTVLDGDVVVHGTASGDQLSRGTAAGDMDGDGYADLMFALPGDDAGAADAGAVWLLAPR
jgi:hypothetical protein